MTRPPGKGVLDHPVTGRGIGWRRYTVGARVGGRRDPRHRRLLGRAPRRRGRVHVRAVGHPRLAPGVRQRPHRGPTLCAHPHRRPGPAHRLGPLRLAPGPARLLGRRSRPAPAPLAASRPRHGRPHAPDQPRRSRPGGPWPPPDPMTLHRVPARHGRRVRHRRLPRLDVRNGLSGLPGRREPAHCREPGLGTRVRGPRICRPAESSGQLRDSAHGLQPRVSGAFPGSPNDRIPCRSSPGLTRPAGPGGPRPGPGSCRGRAPTPCSPGKAW